MNYFRIILLCCLSGFSGMVTAQTDSFTVVPAIDLAFKTNRYSFPSTGPDFVFKSSFTTLVPSVTFAYGSIYTSVNYDFTIADTERFLTGTNADPEFTIVNYGRRDAAVTLGYRLLPTVNIFTGYTQGKGTMLISSTVGTGTSSYATRIYNESGFYVGASYNYAFSDRGALNLSAAYGFLDGRLTGKDDRNVEDIVSKAPGYSINLAWNQAVSKTLSYRIGIKYTSYTFEGKEFISNGVVVPIPRDFNYYEQITAFYIGVTDYF